MTQGDSTFAGSIPDVYDTYLVPLIFEAFAKDLAIRTASRSPHFVLEIAAGSGVVTRSLAPRLAPDARYTVTDLNQSVIDHAASKQGPDGRITWQQADALDLPFAKASFDAVICQFGVMFFSDRIGGYTEVRHVLKPGGRFIFNVWDKIETNEFADVVTEAAAIVFPDDPPRSLARITYGYHDFETIQDELLLAGFSQVSIDTLEEASAAPSPRHPAVAFCQGTPLRNEIESRDASLLDHVTDRAAEAIAARFGNCQVSGMMRGHVVTAEF